MRTIVAIALLVFLSFGGMTRFAAAEDAGAPLAHEEARRALAEGRADLSADPPKQDAARAAFERVIAGGAEPPVLAESQFRLGTLDEEDNEFAKALAHYRACVDAAPTGRWSRTARSRIDWIGTRSEGDLVPLAHLRRMQRNPALAEDPVVLDAFAQEVEGFPPGLVRSEARTFVGETLLKQLRRSDDAVAELEKVLDDPATSAMNAAIVQRDVVELLLARGRLDDAASEVRRHFFDRELAAQVERRLRHRALRRGLLRELAAFAGLVAMLVFWRARRGGRRALAELVPTRRGSLLMAAFGAVSLGGALLLAAHYEAGNLGPPLAAAVLVTWLLALGGRARLSVGASRSWASAAWAASCGASLAAAAFLLIDALDPSGLQRLFALVT